MRLSRQWLFALGAAAFIASIAVVAVSLGRATTVNATIGEVSPTFDPCLDVTSLQPPSDVAVLAAQQPECVTATQRVPKTHTPTPEPTLPATEPPATEPAATEVPATNTPTGGAGAGGIAPPNTGMGGGHETGGGVWLLLLAGTLAVAGAGATVAGYRSR